MIVEAFKDSLELGLSKPGQVVVGLHIGPHLPFSANQSSPAHDSHLRLRLASRK